MDEPVDQQSSESASKQTIRKVKEQDFRKTVRKKSWFSLLVTMALITLLLLASTLSHLRFDWTEGQVYTLSESTVSVLNQLEEPILVRAYITSGLPQPYGRLKRFLKDILQSYHEAGTGNVGFEMVDPASDGNVSAALAAMNVPKVQVQVVEDDQAQVKQGYLAVVIEYLDSKEIIPVVQSEEGFEYLLTRKIKKLTGKGRVKVGVFSGFGAADLKQLRKFQELTTDDYELVNVDFKNTNIPTDIRTLIIAGMDQAPNKEFRNQLKQFRKRGGGVLLLAGNAKPQLSMGFQVEPVDPYANDWMKDDLGIVVESGMVIDQRATRVTVNHRQGNFMARTLVDYPFLPSVTALDAEHIVSAGLESVSVPFASPLFWLGDDGDSGSDLDADSKEKKAVHVLMRSSAYSAVQSGPPFDVNPLVATETRFSGMTRRPSALAFALDGMSLDKTADTEHAIEQATHVKPAHVIVVGSPAFLDDEFMDGGNLVAALNMLDWLSGDEALIQLRSRGVTQRPLEELSAVGRTFFKAIWMFGLPMLIAFVGLYRWWRIKKRRSFSTAS